MYVCMYICMHACMYVCMYACMHAFMYVCMYVCMHACMYVRYVTLRYVRMYNYVHVNVFVLILCKCINKCIHMHMTLTGDWWISGRSSTSSLVWEFLSFRVHDRGIYTASCKYSSDMLLVMPFSESGTLC